MKSRKNQKAGKENRKRRYLFMIPPFTESQYLFNHCMNSRLSSMVHIYCYYNTIQIFPNIIRVNGGYRIAHQNSTHHQSSSSERFKNWSLYSAKAENTGKKTFLLFTLCLATIIINRKKKHLFEPSYF